MCPFVIPVCGTIILTVHSANCFFPSYSPSSLMNKIFYFFLADGFMMNLKDYCSLCPSNRLMHMFSFGGLKFSMVMELDHGLFDQVTENCCDDALHHCLFQLCSFC